MFDVGAVHSGSCLQYGLACLCAGCVQANIWCIVGAKPLCVYVRERYALVLHAAVVECGGFDAEKNPCPEMLSAIYTQPILSVGVWLHRILVRLVCWDGNDAYRCYKTNALWLKLNFVYGR